MSKEILTLLIILNIFFLGFAVLNVIVKDKILIMKRIDKIASGGKEEIFALRKRKQKRERNTNQKFKLFRALESEILSAGLLMLPHEFFAFWCLLAVLPALAVITISGNIVVALALLTVGVFLPPIMLHKKKAKRVDLFEKQLVEAIAVICNSLKSGLNLQQALMSIAKEMPEPISKEFGRVLREINLGSNLERALTAMAARLNSKNFSLIVSAIIIQRQIGGNLSEVLTSLAGTIKDRFKIKSEIKVLTATGRSSGLIVGLMPVLILLFFMMANPSYVEGFFKTNAGIGMLIAAAILETVGFLIIKKIVNIKY